LLNAVIVETLQRCVIGVGVILLLVGVPDGVEVADGRERRTVLAALNDEALVLGFGGRTLKNRSG
jgi:hypothetical protein